MQSPSTLFVARVSRRDLARNRYVWLSTGWMFGFLAVCSAVIAVAPLGYDQINLFAFTGLLVVIALAHLRTPPPAVGTAAGHLSLVAIWGTTAVGLFAFAPHSVPVLASAMFTATLVTSRLIERGEMAAHLLGASVAMVAPSALGLVDDQTVLGTAVVVPTLWVLAWCTVIVLEAAEAQGEELEQLVRRDPLTGVGNRRMLNEQLAEDLDRAMRVQRPLSVLALDLDGFKAINDEIGHAAGDELLRGVAAALVRVIGDHGTVVRQGGDEFCVILPGRGPEETVRVNNAIRAELAAVPLPSGSVTAGFGIASYPRDAVHAGVLLHVADERLREHKGERTVIGKPTNRPNPGHDDDFGRPALYRNG